MSDVVGLGTMPVSALVPDNAVRALSASLRTTVRETHISTLFFVGDRVYKLKKPVTTGFLDWSTPQARRDACRWEVDLNRRLAPDVYLGVLDLIDEEGARRDSLVVMRRLPAERALSALIKADAPVDGVLRALAGLMANFHSGCRHDKETAEAGQPEAVIRNWLDNAAQMVRYGQVGLLEPEDLDEVASSSVEYVQGRRRLFEQRGAAGRIRDGHGDLLADDIYCLDDGIRVLDCLEFDPKLRFGDVLADVAALAMDLERLGAADQAELFLRRYREVTNDDWPASLADHWVAYRAQVRAKVACMRVEDGDLDAAGEARDLLQLCLGHLRKAAVRLVLVGGLPGTGKTTLANALADRLDWVLLSSAEQRRLLTGSVSSTPGEVGYQRGRYRPDITTATYGSLLGEDQECLCLGQSVILDASWSDQMWRDQAVAVASLTGARLIELRCTAPAVATEARLGARRAVGTSASEATTEVDRRMALKADRWPSAHVLSTTARTERVLADALAVVAPEQVTGARRSDTAER